MHHRFFDYGPGRAVAGASRGVLVADREGVR